MALVELTLEVTEEQKFHLEQLMLVSHLEKFKDLIDNMTTLWEWAVNKRLAGEQIASVNEAAKTFTEAHLPALDRIPGPV